MVSEPPPPEFSRVVPLSEIGGTGKARRLQADEAERKALARRFGLLALDSLDADVIVRAESGSYLVEGRFRANGAQQCVASGEPVPAKIDEGFAIRFIADAGHDADAEVEIDAEDCDTLFHDGRAIDLGEAVAQSLGLALDPFPRSPNADAALKAAGVKAENEAGPFGALAALKDKLEKS